MQREVVFRDGVPISTTFDDPYFSLHGGLDETAHVYLDGNGLPARFRDGFHIAELGFGTGLNALACLQSWEGHGSFRFTSFEAYPMSADDMRRALSNWPDLQSAPLVEAWGHGRRTIRIGAMMLEVIVGDVSRTLPDWEGVADAWFLDGFSPAKNPDMWTEHVLREVGRHTAPGGTFATYTAASRIRSRLQAAGFSVERRKGFGRKKHMTVGVK